MQTVIDKIDAQLTLKWENAERTREFTTWIVEHREKFLGVAKIDKDQDETCFELFLKPEACSREEIGRVRALASMESTNETFGAYTNFGVVASTAPSYQKIEFVFGVNRTIHEQSWESAGYVDEMHSIIDDLCKESKLPQEYHQFIGVSFFDELTIEQRREFACAFLKFLTGGS